MVETKIGKILVIGGGFGGIAAALRGRSLGYDVTLIERLDNLGGRAQVLEIDGFKHDAGPTVITAPFLFGELFELFGEDIKDYVTFIPYHRGTVMCFIMAKHLITVVTSIY